MSELRVRVSLVQVELTDEAPRRALSQFVHGQVLPPWISERSRQHLLALGHAEPVEAAS